MSWSIAGDGAADAHPQTFAVADAQVALSWMALKKDLPFLALLLFTAFILRFDFLEAAAFVIDSDEAIVGLMAKHMLEGGPIPTFYYGQHYMGSMEPLLVALSFSIFGVSSFALQLVPLIFSLLLVVLIYLLGIEMAGVGVGRLAAAFCAVPPSSLVVWSVKPRGGFIEIICIGAAALWLTCRWMKATHPGAAGAASIWLLLGFGWWTNNQIIYFILPVLFAMAAVLRDTLPSKADWFGRLLRIAASSLAAFFIGGLPFWLYNAQHGMVSFQMFRGAGGGDLFEHLYGLFTISIPILLGARHFWQTSDIFPAATVFILCIYVLLFLAFVAWRYRQLAALTRFRLDRARPIELAVLLLVVSGAVFSASSFGYLVQAPRYLLPAYCGIFLIVAWVVVALHQHHPKSAVSCAIAIVAINLFSCYFPVRAIPGEPFVEHGERASRDHSQLIAWLADRGVHWVRTNYWIGYRLAFETREQVRFVLASHPYNTRIPEYASAAASVDKHDMPLVLVPSQAKRASTALKATGWLFDVQELSGYSVIHSIRPPSVGLTRVASETLAVRTSHGASSAPLAIDGNVETRWASAQPQEPGMRFAIELASPRAIRAIDFNLGTWWTDFPRRLTVSVGYADGSHEQYFSLPQYDAVLHHFELDAPPSGAAHPPLTLFLSGRPITSIALDQYGHHPVFDWSIAELVLYE